MHRKATIACISVSGDDDDGAHRRRPHRVGHPAPVSRAPPPTAAAETRAPRGGQLDLASAAPAWQRPVPVPVPASRRACLCLRTCRRRSIPCPLRIHGPSTPHHCPTSGWLPGAAPLHADHGTQCCGAQRDQRPPPVAVPLPRHCADPEPVLPYVSYPYTRDDRQVTEDSRGAYNSGQLKPIAKSDALGHGTRVASSAKVISGNTGTTHDHLVWLSGRKSLRTCLRVTGVSVVGSRRLLTKMCTRRLAGGRAGGGHALSREVHPPEDRGAAPRAARLPHRLWGFATILTGREARPTPRRRRHHREGRRTRLEDTVRVIQRRAPPDPRLPRRPPRLRRPRRSAPQRAAPTRPSPRSGRTPRTPTSATS